MQGKSSSVDSDSEISNPSDSEMDQQFLLNHTHLNPADIESTQRYITSPGDTNLSHTNMGNHDGSQNSGGATSGQHSQSQGSDGENKVEHEKMRSPTIGSSSASGTEERNFELDNMFSLENVDININTGQIDDQLLPQNPNMHGVRQNLDFVADQVGLDNEVTTPSIPPLPYTLDLSDNDPYSNGSRVEQEDDGRPGSSMDQRTAWERRSFEGLHGQTSVTTRTCSSCQGQNNLLRSTSCDQNPVTFLNMHCVMNHPSIANPSDDYPPGYGPVPRRFPGSDPSASLASNVEIANRNYRMRTNHARLHDASASSLWSTNAVRQSSHSIPLNNTLEPTSLFSISGSQMLPLTPVGHDVLQASHPRHCNVATNSRIRSSMSYFNIEDGILARREEANGRNLQVNIQEFVPITDIRQMIQEPTNRTLSSRDVSIACPRASRTSTSSRWHPSVGSSWGINFPLQHTSQSLVSPELYQCARTIPRSSHSASHIRSTVVFVQQNDGILGIPLPLSMASTRDARHRIMLEAPRATYALRHGRDLRYEVPHATYVLRRGHALRYEVPRATYAMGHGHDLRYETVASTRAGLYDRHRGMHFDVDRMSYEELLALEEEIGNISTGLSEETILKHLKQRKFLAVESVEIGRCCICLEEYVNGEELGTLNCGHDFHSACIRPWLILKNICPICRLTALLT